MSATMDASIWQDGPGNKGSGSMNFWQKLTEDPEMGPRTGSPLARVAIGLGLLLFDMHILITGAIQEGKGVNATHIHYSDHPKTFTLTVIVVTLGAAWGLVTARKRYLMHDR